MRLIPGKTKVKVELFRGVRIADVVIAAIFAGLLLLVFTSNLPGKLYFALGIVLIAVALLVRMDSEPNYIYLLHILRHWGYHRHFARIFTDEELMRMQAEGRENVSFERLFETEEAPEIDRKAQKKAAKAEYRADQKILKSKKATKEEKDAIWLKRAQQSGAKKQARQAEKAHANARDMKEIVAYTGVEDGMIQYGGKYYGVALEISPVEFRFFSEHRRNNAIENGLGRVLRALPPDYAANIVKIERPINYDAYRENEYKKLENLRHSYEQGFVSEEEFKARTEVSLDRLNEITALCTDKKVVAPFYYLVLFDSDKGQLNNQVETAIDTLNTAETPARRLNDRELILFLKYTNEIDFEERDIENIDPQDYAMWAMPGTVDFKGRHVLVNRMITHNMRVTRYPTVVGDAWLASVLSLPNTKVVIKCRPMDRTKSIRGIDRSLQELRDQYVSTGVDSKRIELADHIETLSRLLAMLQNANETLLETNIYVTAYDIVGTRDDPGLIQPPPSFRRNIANIKRTIRRYYQEAEIRLNAMDFDQMKAFIGSQISAYDPMADGGQGVPSNSLAAGYPWIFASVSDKNGIKLGTSEGVPVFIDFFRRDSERVNSNMVIVGKSGSGKSYATKSLLANLAADDAKIFILDPENEYAELAENLHGKFINVGNAQFGRLNPFHIITALDDDETDGSTVSGSYATHLQFLEEFFHQILPDCERDALEYLNSLIDRMYTNMGITAETELSKLRPEDYPTFDDLYDAILTEFQSTDNDYIRTMLRTLMNYISKFSTGGRNANIWNGPSTITTAENFTVFNFQSLLANRNSTIANAQMLLVLKYIDNEIIKNRDYNTKYGMKRKIVVVIDEAHVFIDTKYPVALDFMFQLAKRIRKYNGMQIVITQNIKDFVGSEEIARKSTAIINACQYSFIFSLAPNDMQDLCKLYEKAGGINEIEQEQIISAPRGQAFTVMSPQSRSTFKVTVPDSVVDMFQNAGHSNGYYTGEAGEKAWCEFLGDSPEKRDAALANRHVNMIDTEASESANHSFVSFEEISEEELQEALHAKSEKQPSVVFEETEEPSAAIPEQAEELHLNTENVTVTAAPILPVMQPNLSRSNATEEKLAELLGRFSYDSILQEIKRSVREEVEKEKAARNAGADVTNLAEVSAETVAESVAESTNKEALGTIFNAEAIAEAEQMVEQEAEESEDSGFDIMALLAAEATRLNDTSPIDMMDIYGEDVISISLEELIHYNSKQ